MRLSTISERYNRAQRFPGSIRVTLSVLRHHRRSGGRFMRYHGAARHSRTLRGTGQQACRYARTEGAQIDRTPVGPAHRLAGHLFEFPFGIAVEDRRPRDRIDALETAKSGWTVTVSAARGPARAHPGGRRSARPASSPTGRAPAGRGTRRLLAAPPHRRYPTRRKCPFGRYHAHATGLEPETAHPNPTAAGAFPSQVDLTS